MSETLRYKRCTGCHRDLPESHYHQDSNTASGLHNRCKTCRSRNVQVQRSATDADCERIRLEGWRLTPVSERPFCAWKHERGYVWSEGASVLGAIVRWYAAPPSRDERFGAFDTMAEAMDALAARREVAA